MNLENSISKEKLNGRGRTFVYGSYEVFFFFFILIALSLSLFFKIISSSSQLKLRRFCGIPVRLGIAMASMPTTTGAEPSSSSQYTYAASTASYFPTPFHLQHTPPVSYIGAAPPPAIPSVQLPVYPAPPSVYSLPQFQQAILFLSSHSNKYRIYIL